MSHVAAVEWTRGDQPFIDNKYARAHVWRFDGGAVVPGSSAPSNVPLPYSDASAVDPEEAMVASLSSCHMLWFLAIAAKAGWVVDRYLDEASGELDRVDGGPRHWPGDVAADDDLLRSPAEPDRTRCASSLSA